MWDDSRGLIIGSRSSMGLFFHSIILGLDNLYTDMNSHDNHGFEFNFNSYRMDTKFLYRIRIIR